MTLSICHEINLARAFGGGEAYTKAFTRALLALGLRVRLYVHRDAACWDDLRAPNLELVPVPDAAALRARLPAARSWLVTQGPTSRDFLAWAGRQHFLTGFAHMPAFGRDLRSAFADYGLVFAVSEYVRQGLAAQGLRQVHAAPLYCAIEAPGGGADTPVFATLPYDWDPRKWRDRALGLLHRLGAPLRPARRFEKRPGITLGIVSLLSPIKQFPELFRHIVPSLAGAPEINLEIFGGGGYAMVRDMRRALAPLAGRARFWGMQRDVGAVYLRLDWLLAGLPEKEALGLNVLEAQFCGTPVLAVDAPPFTETVAEGSGLRYRDPRADQGADFARVLARVRAGERPDPRGAAAAHLARFGFGAFVARVEQAVGVVARKMEGA